MALYEFQCKRCGKKTEVIQLFSDPAPTKCPHCGGALAKLLSSPAFQFKGSGFYSTDYGKTGRKPEDSSKEKEGDSSKGKEGEAGAPREAETGIKGDSAGQGAKESGDSSKEKKDSGPAAASERSSGKTSTAPSSPSKKNTRKK